LDENKAYTECLMSITSIPIFGYFDIYEEYKNQDINDYSCYIIEVLETGERVSIIYDSKYTRVYGYVLKQIKIKCKILYVRNPLNVEEVNFKNSVDELFNKPITKHMKKAISNITTGLLEKKENKASLSKIFTNYNEAHLYALQYGGQMLPILNDDLNLMETKKTYNYIDECYTEETTMKQETLYVVSVNKKQSLINRLTPIKEMIYYNQKIKLLNMYDKLKEINVNITGIKTDCIMYDRGSNKLISENFKLTDNIGDFKIETGKYLVDKKLSVEENELLKPELFKIDTKIFKDEYKTNEINKFIEQHKNILIKGNFPGVGKSTLAKKYDNNCLFVCPYNKLCQVLKTEGYNAITYCKLFGLVGSDEEMKNVKSFDFADYKTIVFDEIFLYEPQRLKRISKLMQENSNIHFIATGDCDQRDPISFNNSNYLNTCMNILFNQHIQLNEIKRFEDTKDKIRIQKLKEDIFNTELSVEDICKKHKLNIIRKFGDVKTLINICLFNFRCDTINSHIHKNILGKKELYNIGDEIICKKYERKYKLNTNYTYRIMKINKKDIFIKDEVEDKEYKITECILRNHFKLPYALTCDSVQGLSFKDEDKITVFDSNTPYVDRKFLWTAITRARKLDNVSVFIHPKEEIERLTQSRIRLYFNCKVSNYKQQDKKAKRELNNDDYVDEPWINDELLKNKYSCIFCKKHMELYIDEKSNVISNITVDRKDNNKSHTKQNSQLCCLNCNIKKGNRY
jgi:hypothetical protein